MACSRPDGRRSHRIPIDAAIRSEVNARFEAALLDLSSLGARLEHRTVVRSGQIYLLTLHRPDSSAPVSLEARAIWSWVHRFEPGKETGGLVFHSGVEFEQPTRGVQRSLAEILTEAEVSGLGPLGATADVSRQKSVSRVGSVKAAVHSKDDGPGTDGRSALGSILEAVPRDK